LYTLIGLTFESFAFIGSRVALTDSQAWWLRSTGNGSCPCFCSFYFIKCKGDLFLVPFCCAMPVLSLFPALSSFCWIMNYLCCCNVLLIWLQASNLLKFMEIYGNFYHNHCVKVFGSVVSVVFQSVFCSIIYQSNIFFIFKKLFLILAH